MASMVERLGRGIDNWIQRRLTPASERDSLERDLVRQQTVDSANGRKTERDVYLGFDLGDPTNPFPILRSDLETLTKEKGSMD